MNRRRLALLLFLPVLLGSRLFDRTVPDFLETDTAFVTTAPFTVCGWFNTAVVDDDTIISLVDKDVGDNTFSLRINTSNKARWRVQDTAGGQNSVTSTTSYSINTWHSMCAVEAATNDRRVYLDGGGKGTSTSSRTPVGIDRTSIGRMGDSTPGNEFDGKLAHIAVWSAALTDGEIAIYAAGVSPRRIRTSALVLYIPINGQSPELNLAGVNLTVNGTPSVDEEPPDVYFPIIAP